MRTETNVMLHDKCVMNIKKSLEIKPRRAIENFLKKTKISFIMHYSRTLKN